MKKGSLLIMVILLISLASAYFVYAVGGNSSNNQTQYGGNTNDTQISCNSDSDCMEVVCPLGGFVHYQCVNSKCTLNAICSTKACAEGCTCIGETTTCPTNQTLTCQEVDGSCCLNGICSVSAASCLKGQTPVFKGCDDECRAKVECAVSASSNGTNSGASNNATKTTTKEVETAKGNITITKTIIRDCNKENDSITCTRTKEMEIERTNGNETIIKIKNVSVTIVGEIETDDKNRTFFKWDNVSREIKIMPDTASDRAIERLQIKVCNESNNCTIQLKDVGLRSGEGNQTRMKYIVHALKERRFLWWHWNKQVRAEVDAETGKVD